LFVTATAALALAPTCLAAADGGPVLQVPLVTTAFTATPAPIPAPRERRMPVSLRLADTIATINGSHPLATTAVRFELDEAFRFDMTKVAACSPLQGRDAERSRSPCDVGKLAGGRLETETQFPGQGPVRVSGEATAYKTGPRKILIYTYLGAPVTASILIPVKVGEAPGDRYGVKFTAAVPKLAGAAGSLTYLGLRFRRGLFSAACPSGSLESGGANVSADGTVSAGSSTLRCWSPSAMPEADVRQQPLEPAR
jgi:hypothetical protein